MKIYIAGAITNNPNYKEQFAKTEKELIEKGYKVVNPVKPEGNTYKWYIDEGLKQLMECDAIYMLKGWVYSKGARLEYMYAVTVGMIKLEENNETRI